MPNIQIRQNIDPYFNNVSLLLPFDSNFTDYSKNNFTATQYDNVQISTTQSKFGGGSAYFDGNGDYLNIIDSTAFGFEIGDFTLEAWVYALQLPVSDLAGIIDLRSAAGANGVAFFLNQNANEIFFYNGADNTAIITNTTVSLNQWTHIACQRFQGNWSVYINGVKDLQTLFSESDVGNTQPCFIGTAADSPSTYRNFNGYIDDLRITKGIARYTSNFTPPSKLPLNINNKISIKKTNLGGGRLLLYSI